MRRSLRSRYVNHSRSNHAEADFSIEKYGAKTREKEECKEQLLAEYATLLGFYIAGVAVLTGIAMEKSRLPRRFSLLDLALLGIATHKLSRIVAKDRITSILRAPFVSYIRSAGAGGWRRNHVAVESSAALATWFRAHIAWRRGAQQHSRSALYLRRV